MSRHQARKDAMIYCYQSLLREQFNQALDQEAFLDLEANYQKIIYYIQEEKEGLIELIDDELTEWTFDRLGFIEQAILLLTCAEAILLRTPKTVLMNEAILLSKEFGDQDETYKLINATLDKVLDI